MAIVSGLAHNQMMVKDGGAKKKNEPTYYDTGTVITQPVKPTEPRYQTYSASAPVYNSPTAGAQYSYSQAAPTWSWDDSGRPGDWTFDQERPTYTNEYQDQINSMVDAILNREKFSYDYNADPLYAQYKEAYTRNGQQAMKDTYGQQAARTGGLASSYAGTAAQSAYNQYMNALNDKIPELYKLAYSMYQDEGNTMRNNLSMVQGLENTAYGRYQDDLGQWNTDRNFSYGQYQDDWDRYYNDRDFSYGQYRDSYDDWYNERNYDYGMWQDNLDRQEAAAKAAYNSRLAAYNSAQQSVANYNAQQDKNYQAAMDAYNKQMTAYNNAQSKSSVTTNSNGYQWNGKNYTSLAQLRNAINATDLTDSEWNSLKRSLLQNHVLTEDEFNNMFG